MTITAGFTCQDSRLPAGNAKRGNAGEGRRTEFKFSLDNLSPDKWTAKIAEFTARVKAFADDYEAHPGKADSRYQFPKRKFEIGFSVFSISKEVFGKVCADLGMQLLDISSDMYETHLQLLWQQLSDEEKSTWNTRADEENQDWIEYNKYNGTPENLFTYRGQRCEVYRASDLTWRAFFETPEGFTGWPQSWDDEHDNLGASICHGGITGGASSWDCTTYLVGMDFHRWDDFALDHPHGTIVWTWEMVVAELHKAVDYCLEHVTAVASADFADSSSTPTPAAIDSSSTPAADAS